MANGDANGEANDAEMDVEKVLVKEDGGGSMTAPDKLVERTLSTTVKVEKHGKTDARHVSNTLESEKLLKSVRLQQQIRCIKEVQMSRLRAKRLAKGT